MFQRDKNQQTNWFASRKQEASRVNLSAVFIFNFLHCNIDSLELKIIIKSNNNDRPTRVSSYLTDLTYKTNQGLNSPLCRGIRILNTKINSFNQRLIDLIDSIPLRHWSKTLRGLRY
jgi:hypothetical protein